MKRWLPGLPFLLAVATAHPVTAQSVALAEDIASLRDSLALVEDVAALEELWQSSRLAADSLRGDTEAELRLGFLDLRLAQLTDNGLYWEEASRTFEWLAKDHPDLGVAWVGFGFASIGEARTTMGPNYGLKKMLGSDPAKDIVARFISSTGPDSLFGHELIELGHLALRSREPIAVDVALQTLRALPAGALARDADLALARIQVEREFGDKDSTAAVTNLATRLHRDHPALLRAQAMARFFTGRVDGVAPWYRGLRLAEGQILGRFYRDLSAVLPDSVLQDLRAASAVERESVVRRFWASQDADGLPTEDDRLAEHYRRLDFARFHYVRNTLIRSGVEFERDTLGLAAFDRRGEIILLHGSPTKRSSLGRFGGAEVDERMGLIGMPPNESWRYIRTDGQEQFYHFLAVDNESDFEIVESVFDILANSNQFRMFRGGSQPLNSDSSVRIIKTHGAELVSTIAQELMQSRRRLSPIYTDILNGGRDGADSLQRLERAIGRKSLEIPYSYELDYELPMAASITALALGSDHLGSILQIAFAIEANHLISVRLERGQVYPVRMRVAALDSATGRVVQVVDTTRSFITAARLRSDQHLVGQLPLRLQPGVYRIRVAVESGRRGRLTAPVFVTVPKPVGGGLTLTDLSLGRRSIPIPWRSPTADTAWANPLGVFDRDESMQLYFEVGGLEAGTSYQSTLAIDRLQRSKDGSPSCTGSGRALVISSQRRHPGVVDRVQNDVSLEQLRDGEYVITATMETDAGESVSRCRQFTVGN